MGTPSNEGDGFWFYPGYDIPDDGKGIDMVEVAGLTLDEAKKKAKSLSLCDGMHPFDCLSLLVMV